MTANLLREKLRVERELVGDAHPFVALSYQVRCGAKVWGGGLERENPALPVYSHPWDHPKNLPDGSHPAPPDSCS